ncbi:glycosyl transferase family 25 [Maritimibacter sp. 55A14]|nr:glycosyl transferase family 25 [Maritimibacter sp. 55A14]
MAFQAAQLSALGLAFERLEAATPATLSPPADARYWTGWERPLRQTEMAAFASHRAAWERIATGTAPMLVLEDDALLAPGTADFLERVAPLAGIDHITLETRGRRKLVARRAHPAAPMRRLWQDRTGAAAYLLWPAGARKLLERTRRRPGLADAVLCAAYDLSSWQADPALAIQLDQCAAHGLTPPIPTASAIGRERRPGKRAYPLRRLAAQIRMGVRQLARLPGAERRLIAPTPDMARAPGLSP